MSSLWGLSVYKCLVLSWYDALFPYCDCWNVRCIGNWFHGSHPPSFGLAYILVVVHYVSKWAEALATMTDDHKALWSNNLYGTPRARISDRGATFSLVFEALLRKYYVTRKVATPITLRLVVKLWCLIMRSSPYLREQLNLIERNVFEITRYFMGGLFCYL